MSHDNKTILIVDDEPGIVSTLARIFRRQGYRVLQATSGREALELAVTAPDLLLTDIRMPGMDGVELARRMREGHPELVIMFMTAWAQSEQVSAATQAGACAVFSKPFNLDLLLREIQTIFNRTPILILDDDTQFTASLERVLQREGFSVLSAAKLAECRQHLSVMARPILLIDMRLDGMSGLEALETLQQDFPPLRAIVITGFPELLPQGEQPECIQHCFQKPVDIPRLLDALKSLQT